MKRLGFAVVGLALLGIARAAPLADEEAQFISQEIGSATVYADCPDYEMVPNAAETIGDRMGVGENIRAAVMAAYAQTLDNQPFNRAYLIPEVTRRVNMVMSVLEQRRQQNNLCGLGPAYTKRGWLRLKGG
ncbi:hypothetical protein [Bradyrhizobium erythrophlei]|jgi:hypothetical protein|uniref:Rap1a immunity protein domain-containing protein n=1 Tax=Bradyrhizobium erythrophlei TaxID=1437360 RepID=A0A1M5MQJ4_9BRAD|nr:hypothetical protein [Bradyrhizobium erythrophlei]SHG79680.1 hypothetical protein SAMN05443248_2687 [Bradyrhizobium erythrophlei]